jgi:hypothetical protein
VLLLGSRLQTGLATWASRNSADMPAYWVGEDFRAPASGYISLAETGSQIVSNSTTEGVECASARRATFAPVLGQSFDYTLFLGKTPIVVRVDAADDAAAAQARVPEAWAVGQWAQDGWTLSDFGGGEWQISAPAVLGIVPTLTPGTGWTLGTVDSVGARDVTIITTLCAIQIVYWLPARSRLLGHARAANLQALVRSQSGNTDRGAELGLSFGARPSLGEPVALLPAQADLGGLVDAETIDLAVYAHTVTSVGSAGLGGGILQVQTVPSIPLPELAIAP